MLGTLFTLTLGGLLACTPLECDEPVAKPPCSGIELILSDADSETDCDVIPPQILSYFMDDSGPVQEQECLDAGGRLQTDDLLDRLICYDIDY